MPDWTKSMEQTYEFYKVNPNPWKETEPIRTITSCTVTRDSSQETLGSASLNCTEDLGECYVRVYLVTRQNRIKERFCLGTFLTQTPEFNYDGKTSDISIDCYTPLLELKDVPPPLGYTVFKGSKTLNAAFDIVRENCRAPLGRVSGYDGLDHALTQDFVSDTDDTWLSYTTDLISNAGYQFALEDDCSIYFDRIKDLKTMQPMYTFSDNNSSLLGPSIKDKRDLYGIPNVLEMLFTSETNDYYYAVVENNDPNSEVSIQRRGRRVVKRETKPNFPGNPTKEEFDEYAIQTLKDLSTLEHTVTFTHGFVPKVRLGTCVRLNYTRAGLTNIRARITSQSIKCGTGCMVDATATYTTELWDGTVVN